MKSWPNVARKRLQSCKKVQQKSRDIACKAKFLPPYLRQVAKIYVATSHNVVWLETIEISKQRTAFIWCFAQEVDWCLKDCDKQRLQTTASKNLWKIFAGHTGDRFDVRTASICTTDLWDALKSFILNSLKFKVAPYPIIVSLDTLTSSFEHGDSLACVYEKRVLRKGWGKSYFTLKSYCLACAYPKYMPFNFYGRLVANRFAGNFSRREVKGVFAGRCLWMHGLKTRKDNHLFFLVFSNKSCVQSHTTTSQPPVKHCRYAGQLVHCIFIGLIGFLVFYPLPPLPSQLTRNSLKQLQPQLQLKIQSLLNSFRSS